MLLDSLRADIEPGKSGRTDEWMQLLNDRLQECEAALPDERVAFEPIFRHTESDGRLALTKDSSSGHDSRQFGLTRCS